MAGLATVAPFGFSFDPVRFLMAYRGLGCRTAQFYRNTASPPSVRDVRQTSDRAGIRIDSIHGVFGPDLHPCSPDASHRAACVKTYEEEGLLARDLGGPMVVVHPARFTFGGPPLSRENLAEREAELFPNLHDFMLRLAEVGERLGVTYLIENLPDTCELGRDAAELARRVLAVKSPRIRMCFDTGHAHIMGPVSEAFEQSAAAVDYIHLNDNHGVIDEHLMPFDGEIDWVKWGAAARRARTMAPMMLEVFYDEARVERLAASGLGARLATLAPAAPGDRAAG